MRDKLSQEDIEKSLNDLQGWELVEGRSAITKTFEFKNFIECFGWMSRVALISEKMDHHPEWLNIYKTVDVTLSTHSADGLTALDFKLAQKMEQQLL